MLYEEPNMKLIVLESEDVITLSVGDDTYDPTIDKTPGNSGDNPWS